MTIDKAKKLIKNIPSVNGRKMYPMDLKVWVCNSINSNVFSSLKQAEEVLGLRPYTVKTWFKSTRIERVLISKTVEHGKSGQRHTIGTKIRAVEMFKNKEFEKDVICHRLAISTMTLNQWIIDYDDKKFDLDQVTQVTRKEVAETAILMEEYEELKTKLAIKAKELKRAMDRDHKKKIKELELIE